MKFILILIFGLIIALGAPVLVVLLINRKHKVKNYVKAIVIPISSLALLVSFVLIYFAFNYKASDEAKSYLNGDALVSVTDEKNWYRFDNLSSNENAIVFYAGNHAYFGDYGFQRGDGAASISRDEQTRQTKNAVVDFIVNPS